MQGVRFVNKKQEETMRCKNFHVVKEFKLNSLENSSYEW